MTLQGWWGQLLVLGPCWGLLELSSSVIVLLRLELAKFCVSLITALPSMGFWAGIDSSALIQLCVTSEDLLGRTEKFRGRIVKYLLAVGVLLFSTAAGALTCLLDWLAHFGGVGKTKSIKWFPWTVESDKSMLRTGLCWGQVHHCPESSPGAFKRPLRRFLGL